MNKQKISIVVGSLAVVIVLIFAWMFFRGSVKQGVSMEEPIDIVLNFYDQWLLELQSPDTDPYQSGLAQASILSKELKKKIKNAGGNVEGGLDPVLCQTTPDVKIATREVYKQEDKAQIVVTSRDQALTGQAIIMLLKYNEGWYIDDISCSPGEFGPPREFSFEREGFLLKDNIPAPYDSQYWHLVFEENDEQGHVAPLFFNAESECTNLKEEKTACVPEQFSETNKVLVQGEMTERGAEVKKLKFLEE